MKIIFTLFSLLCSVVCFSQNQADVYIDKKGVMRWTNNNNEASFYGVNYTLPFAHAYRAINYTNNNHKQAIDKDVYHFARLGFNAYRIHIWDVEISDKQGNLLENTHLDLLDYLIAKLKERNIHVLITAMTTFGNGYPEKNQHTEGFSSQYNKCEVHSNENAIAAQEKYISQLVTHINPYTKLSYKDDSSIVGFEINNEPCHAVSPLQTQSYINRMLKAAKTTGNTKPLFYNVSHNMTHVQAYFNTPVQGTTYQWYPIGLVAGHTRRGNFLPYVDSYDIPFSNLKGFSNKAKAVYEFDPADISYSYMYPAMARTFRSQGFQWITQFAYDPIDIAWANTEYQTHYLNLAYTPNKAISMAIAAEVAYTVPLHKKYDKYPNDTIFGDFCVSYKQDLSELNGKEKFFYSNNTTSHPIDSEKLQNIIGYGNSSIIQYEGTGAYFLDKLEDGLWRLEVMPDAIQIEDPYAKPSLKKEVVTIAWNAWDMNIKLPHLGENFTASAINKGNTYNATSVGTTFSVKPGVYLLQRAGYSTSSNWKSTTNWGTISLGEYVAPQAHAQTFSVVHKPAAVVEAHKPLLLEAQIVGPTFPDSVLIYTDKISFWSDNNPYIKMKRTHGYTYSAQIPENSIYEGIFKYTIVVCANKNYTFPAAVEGHPLDWDFYQTKYWETEVVNPKKQIELVKITDEYSSIDTYGIPESSFVKRNINSNDLQQLNSLDFRFEIKNKDARFYWRKYIKEDVSSRIESLQKASYLCLNLKNVKGIDRLKVGFVTSNGFTYTSLLNIDNQNKIYKIALSQLAQDKTTLLPAPYPVFLDRYFRPDVPILFKTVDIEMFEMSTLDDLTDDSVLRLESVWIE